MISMFEMMITTSTYSRKIIYMPNVMIVITGMIIIMATTPTSSLLSKDE